MRVRDVMTKEVVTASPTTSYKELVQLLVARDGVEATEHLKQSEYGRAVRPDLVLLDLNLPRKDGKEVLAEVKASPSLKQIPVLVMTSSRSDEDIAEAYSLNANCYITKPGDLQEYVHVVRAIEEFWFLTATLPDGYNSSVSLPHQMAQPAYAQRGAA